MSPISQRLQSAQATVAAVEVDQIVAAAGAARIAAVSNGTAASQAPRARRSPAGRQCWRHWTPICQPFAASGTVVENLFPATPAQRRHRLGSAVRRRLAVATGAQSDPIARPGTRVVVGIDPASVTLFPGSAGGEAGAAPTAGDLRRPTAAAVDADVHDRALRSCSPTASGPSSRPRADFQFSNYALLFADPQYYQVLLRTLKIALLVSIAALLLAYPLAYFLVFKVRSPRLRLAIYMATVVPLWVSYLLRAYTWKTILGSEGVINSFLVWSGCLRSRPISSSTTSSRWC
jgi:ABC-type sugar transport system permease subunit